MTNTTNNSNKKRIIVPPIPLERPAKKSLRKDEYLTFKLRNNPADNNSTTYEATVPFFRTGTPEEVLDFVRDVRRVFTGQNLTNGPQKYALMRRLLKDDALAAFNAAAEEQGAENNQHFLAATNGLIRYVFPQRALSMQKRCMRRFMRKPAEMKMRAFMSRLGEINGKLSMFPPFGNNQQLPQDEILDIGEYATPNSWQKSMIIQNFNPQENDVNALVNFCERMERTEDKEPPIKKQKKELEKDYKIPKKGPSNYQGKWCDYCEQDTHTTKACNHLKRLKAERNDNKKKYQWKRNDNNNGSKKDYTKEELHAAIGEAIKEQLKDLKKSNKRKAEHFTMEEEEELHKEFDSIELSDTDAEEHAESTGHVSDSE